MMHAARVEFIAPLGASLWATILRRISTLRGYVGHYFAPTRSSLGLNAKSFSDQFFATRSIELRSALFVALGEQKF